MIKKTIFDKTIKRVNKLKKLSVFGMSDIHGIHPRFMKSALKKQGFDIKNPNHLVVIAGDIIDGFGNEQDIVNYLRELHKAGRLLAVRGNHDFGPSIQVNYQHRNKLSVHKYKSIADYNWLKSFPYQLETKFFNMAHGIWLPYDMLYRKDDHEFMSIWGSPILLAEERDDWWWVSDLMVETVKTRYKSSIMEYVRTLNKDTYIGHFDTGRIAELIDNSGAAKEDYAFSDEGLISFGEKLYYLDSSVILNDSKRIICRRFEYNEKI